MNGVKVMLRGSNRHSFNPETGRTTSKSVSINDVKLMQEMNMNAVRMSHYPPDVHFLDVCDSLGLYVMDVQNLHKHNFILIYSQITIYGIIIKMMSIIGYGKENEYL